MWYFNFCSPFRYQPQSELRTARFVMYISLLVLLVVYIFYIVKFKLYGKQIPVRSAYVKENAQDHRMVVSYAGMGEREYRMDQKKHKEWYTHYYGLHSIAVAAAIMYAPYIAQMVFVIIWTVLFIVCTVLNACRKQGAVKIVFNVALVICVLLDIILLFSATMGVGASQYDNAEKICYLQR